MVQPGFASTLLIESVSNMIMVEMARYGRRLGQSRTPSRSQGLAPWQLRRIQERIEGSLELGYPNIEELARICSISLSHLMRSFKKSTGWPIHKYVAEERLQMAKAMLENSQINLTEIASHLRFRSPAYFSTAFRRMTDSPRLNTAKRCFRPSEPEQAPGWAYASYLCGCVPSAHGREALQSRRCLVHLWHERLRRRRLPH